MKYIPITVFFIGYLHLCIANANDINWDELVEKNGTYYHNSMELPFDGQVTGSQSGKIVQGKKDGPWIGFYEDGSVLWEGLYYRGTTLSWKEYHDNGEIFVTGEFNNGKKDGRWDIYDKKGKLIAQEFFKSGKIIETKIIK